MLLTFVIVANVKKDDLEEIVTDALERTLNESKEKDEYKASWHLLQTEVRTETNDSKKKTKSFYQQI